jgi:hypothetical protein
MKSYRGSVALLALCLLAAAPALADDDDDDRRVVTPSPPPTFLGEIFAIVPGTAPPPAGKLPNPPNTSRVFVLAGGQRVLFISGIPTTNPSQMRVGATLWASGTLRADDSVVATGVAFAPRGAPGNFAGRIDFILGMAKPPPGALPNPRNTSQVFVLSTGEKVIVIAGTPVDQLQRMARGNTLSGMGVPRADGSIVATRIRFDGFTAVPPRR